MKHCEVAHVIILHTQLYNKHAVTFSFINMFSIHYSKMPNIAKTF